MAKGATVDKDALRDDTQPWRAIRPEDEGWLAEDCG